eukprot:541738_1
MSYHYDKLKTDHIIQNKRNKRYKKITNADELHEALNASDDEKQKCKCCCSMNKKVNKEDEESIQNKSRSWTSNIIKFSKNLLNDDFNLLPCLAGSIAMIIFIKYRKSIANLLSAFLLFIALLLPHFIQHFYDAQGTKTCYRNLARWIDFHSLICVTLFIYGTVYGPYYDTDFLFILKYAILLFITS